MQHELISRACGSAVLLVSRPPLLNLPALFCQGNVHAGLVDAIRPHLTAVRNSPYGKRILSQANLKLGRGDEGPEVDVRR
jgi:hypothetical protein